jgi:hypothetical protein
VELFGLGRRWRGGSSRLAVVAHTGHLEFYSSSGVLKQKEKEIFHPGDLGNRLLEEPPFTDDPDKTQSAPRPVYL